MYLFLRELPNHHILDKLYSHEYTKCRKEIYYVKNTKYVSISRVKNKLCKE